MGGGVGEWLVGKLAKTQPCLLQTSNHQTRAQLQLFEVASLDSMHRTERRRQAARQVRPPQLLPLWPSFFTIRANAQRTANSLCVCGKKGRGVSTTLQRTLAGGGDPNFNSTSIYYYYSSGAIRPWVLKRSPRVRYDHWQCCSGCHRRGSTNRLHSAWGRWYHQLKAHTEM